MTGAVLRFDFPKYRGISGNVARQRTTFPEFPPYMEAETPEERKARHQIARNYAVLPHEYLEEMDILKRRGVWAALQGATGVQRGWRLEGAEKVLWKRVKKQEDRFQEHYKELSRVGGPVL